MRIFADLLHVVDTHVFNGTGAVPEALDVEVHDFNAQLFHVRHHVFRDLLGHALAILHHFLQAHAAHDFTHVALQHLRYHGDQLGLLHAQQRFSRAGKQRRIGGDFHVGHAVHHHVDELVGGHGLAGLYVHGHYLQRQLIHALQEGDSPAGFTDQNALFAKAGDNKGCVRRGLEIARGEQDDAQRQGG